MNAWLFLCSCSICSQVLVQVGDGVALHGHGGGVVRLAAGKLGVHA